MTGLPDAVFWDWDGTLSDSYEFLNDAHNHTLVTLGFEAFKPGEYRTYFGKPREVLYPAIYKDKAEEAKEVFGAYVFDNAHKIKLIPGALEVLNFLHKSGVEMGIVSNKKAAFIQEELRHMKIGHIFTVVIGAGEASADKPSGAPLLFALEKAGVSHKKQSVWYIGDTENDLACAKDAGCPALFLKGDPGSENLIREYKPLFSFENYLQLREFFDCKLQ